MSEDASSKSSLQLVELSVEDLKALDEHGEAHTCETPLKVVDAVLQQYETMVADRRHFHKFPELSFQEHETAKKIVTILKEDVGLRKFGVALEKLALLL